MTHISIRLPWHDRGWDGCVCDKPRENCYCKGFNSISAEKIRKEKDDTKEENLKGQALDASWAYYPPCSETINVFGNTAISHTFNPPEFIHNTSKKKVEIPPNCGGTWPFEGMWDRDTGIHLPAAERKENAQAFFEKVEKSGEAGLVFYYCNYDNPVSGDDKKYALVGIARIKKISSFIEWDDIPQDQQERYGNFIWSRLVENNPEERIRLPYQEYIAKGKDVRKIAVFAEGDLTRSFKYGAHHVNDDDAISMIDKTIASVKTIIEENYLDKEIIEDWKKRLEWLRGIRKECWGNRGLFPGLVPVLRFLGMENPEQFIRTRLINHNHIPPERIKDYFFDRFEGREKIGILTDKPLESAAGRYQAMIQSETEKIKALLCRDKMPYFALDEDQLKNILNDGREKYNITSALDSIYENPYIITEEYLGSDEGDYISFDKIDHGMMPDEALGGTERISLDDWRRLRALMYTMLKDAASGGHTFLEWADLSGKVNKWHSQNDKGDGMFNFDRTAWEQHKTDYEPKIVEDHADGLFAIYLKRLHDAESVLSKEFRKLVNGSGIESAGITWEKLIDNDEEQVDALRKLFTSRLTVLTGAAGTGKTKVICSFIKGLKEKEPHHDFLVLAPTGKASLILRDRINDPSIHVMTIHSFLMRKGWINAENFTLKEKGGGKSQAATVIVDECSMIETMLFGTLIRALDMNNIERLILVGDYNQLPPIGPGKVFYDLIKYLKDDKDKTSHLAELRKNWRQIKGSKSIVLAQHYTRSTAKADESIFSDIELCKYDITKLNNQDDLVIDYWEDDDDLIKKLPTVLEYAIARLNPSLRTGELGERYNEVHGIPFSNEKNIEAINIIAPYRHTPSGVDNINLALQKILRGEAAVYQYADKMYHYVFCDKVLQIKNYNYYAFDHRQQDEKKKKVKNDDTYIPNGTLGYVFPNRNHNFMIKFPKDYENLSYYLTETQAGQMLELGYATSVHKAQGSQFDVTIMIIPEESTFLNREMLYTALTRAKKCQIILIQNGIGLLKSRLWLGHSDIAKRNSSLFNKSRGIPPEGFEKYKPENLIYEALPGLLVRSQGELEISQALARAEIGFYYEKILPSKDGKSFKLPDFTFKYNRKEWYWEHKGMMDNFDYAQRDEKKTRWYIENGYQDNLIETPLEGMNLTESIKYIFENRLGIRN